MRAVQYGTPIHPRVGATLPMSDKRPPAGLVGILQSSDCQRPPHSRPLKPWSPGHAYLGAGRPLHPRCSDAGRAILAPPTGNEVLNQIPAGDGRESSREQVVPDDGVLFLHDCFF